MVKKKSAEEWDERYLCPDIKGMGQYNLYTYGSVEYTSIWAVLLYDSEKIALTKRVEDTVYNTG